MWEEDVEESVAEGGIAPVIAKDNYTRSSRMSRLLRDETATHAAAPSY